jgi:hypothetical protein
MMRNVLLVTRISVLSEYPRIAASQGGQMAKLIVDFEWPVAASYRYEPPEKSPAGANTLATGGKRFGSIVASGQSIIRRPLDGHGGFLKILLSGMLLREIALKAATTYGMLICQSAEEERESLYWWKQLIDELKTMRQLDDSSVIEFFGLSIGARLEVLLLPAKGRERPRLGFRPVNLREAIKIYWATTVASGGSLRPCRECSEFFEAGGESTRRADAQFCSDTCRHRFNNALKRTHALG